ncbi:MAG: (2Fe-2S)-binding protein [Caldilineaceae bacterium]
MAGLLTITGGKWTTFRLMAEVTMDAACAQLGVTRPCRTADTRVPGVDQGHYWLGHRLHEVEEDRLQSELVCECELVTRRMLEHAARSNPTVTLDDLRRDVRLGMGPCQGGFCTYRAVGIIHEMQQNGAKSANGDADATAAGWDVAYMQSPGHIGRAAGQPHRPPQPAAVAHHGAQPAAARFPAGALEGGHAYFVGATTQTGAAGRTHLPEPHERRPPARGPGHQPAHRLLPGRHHTRRRTHPGGGRQCVICWSSARAGAG